MQMNHETDDPTGSDVDHADFPFLQQEAPDKAAEYFRLALKLIGDRRATPIPLNYALFYFHVAGANLLFSEKMDRLLENDAGWPHEDAVKLFMRYFTPCSDASMADLQRDLLAVVNSLVESMAGGLEAGGRHVARLDEQLARLDSCTDPRQARRIASEILAEAHQLVSDSQVLETGLRRSAQEVERLKEELLHARREAALDALTGLNNRRAFDNDLDRLMQTGRFCLVMLDIDHFKDINDQHGHLVGDRVLRQLARQISARIRSGDTVARYGGEEFAILLPDTLLADAQHIAENVRESIGMLNMRRTDTGAPLGRVTASFGVAEYRAGEDRQHLIARADAAMYDAKHAGRNRVMCAA